MCLSVFSSGQTPSVSRLKNFIGHVRGQIEAECVDGGRRREGWTGLRWRFRIAQGACVCLWGVD